MADGYYGHQPHAYPSSQLPKRTRSDYDDLPGISDLGIQNYLPKDDDCIGLRDPTSIGASYDRYLQTAQKVSFGSGESDNGSKLARGFGGRLPDLAEGMQSGPFRDPGRILAEGRGGHHRNQLSMNPPLIPQLPGWEPPLPPNASDTIFVEGLPCDCTEREVAHIFRPFLGYKEVRLVTKESKYEGSDPKVLGFVEFTSATCAATAMNALKGYKMNLRDSDSPVLKLQFSHCPDPKLPKPLKPGHGRRSER